MNLDLMPLKKMQEAMAKVVRMSTLHAKHRQAHCADSRSASPSLASLLRVPYCCAAVRDLPMISSSCFKLPKSHFWYLCLRVR